MWLIFTHWKIKFLPLSDTPQEEMSQKLLWWWIIHCGELSQKERKIGLTITEQEKSENKKCDRNTLIEHSA